MKVGLFDEIRRAWPCKGGFSIYGSLKKAKGLVVTREMQIREVLIVEQRGLDGPEADRAIQDESYEI